MAIEHALIPDAQLHEPKGVASATAKTMYVANGAGSGTWTFPIRRFTAALTPSIVTANTTVEQTFTITGLVAATDRIIGVSKPTAQAGLGIVGWRCSADNTLAITFSNNTGASITPTAGETYTVFANRE